MWQYSIESRIRRYIKGYGFLSFARKYTKQLLNAGLDSLKTASKKVVHKAGGFSGNKVAEVVTLSQTMIILRNKNMLKK